MLSSTVAALSTAPGKAGVALIRISGAQTLSILKKIFYSPKSPRPVTAYPPRVAQYGRIMDGDRVLDDVLVTYFAAGASYTGEDVAEISCHGGVVVSRMILELVLKNGANMAGPGEFTRRAFVAGRMSLTEVEGVGRLLEAQTPQAALLASQTARGVLSDKIQELYRSLLTPVSSLYACIDYPEEDMEEITDDQLKDSVEATRAQIRDLLATRSTGLAVMDGVPTVIVGRPNVGKSTLFNAILGQEKAIVTDRAGTTRDLLEYPARAGRLLLRLMDTAGIRENSPDPIEQMGIDRALAQLENAQGAVLALFDASLPAQPDDYRLLERLSACPVPVIYLLTKCDLPQALEESFLQALPQPIRCRAGQVPPELVERLEQAFIRDDRALEEGLVLTDLRQADQLQSAERALTQAMEALEAGLKDACGALLEEALAALEGTDGRGVSQAIVNDIFSRFCVGK